MSTIMEQLWKDHENVSLMMDVLAEQLDAVHEMESADFELMHDIMLYMTQYPDRIHHPMEDLMFDRMASADAKTAGAIEDLRREHVALAEKGLRFLEMLALVVDGSMVERTRLEETGRDYVAFMRHHMNRENVDVFPSAEASLSEADWQAVADSLEAREDPVFGAIVAEQFTSLLAHIRGRMSST